MDEERHEPREPSIELLRQNWRGGIVERRKINQTYVIPAFRIVERIARKQSYYFSSFRKENILIRNKLLTNIPLLFLFLSNPSMATEIKEMKELTGEWECVSAVNDGKEVDEATVKKLRLTLTKEGAYKTTLGDRILFDSTCKIDSTKTPKSIDMIGTEGENKGKAAQGIYKLVEGKLSICYTMPGKQRPTDFKSESGSAATLVRWQRKKP